MLYSLNNCSKVYKMATQIKDTPKIKGKDAQIFFETIDTNESQKFNQETIKKIQNSYAKISKLLKK